MLPKISVIIPVYNTEKYLTKAISSILNSSIKNDIEIIVVDDASNGNCEEIINNYKEKITYIRHKKNKGIFQSRFTGYNLAKGDFIIQLDPDDWIINDIYAEAYFFAKKNNSDIVMFNMQNVDFSNKTWSNKNEKIHSFNNKCGLDIIKQILFSNTSRWTLHTCWNKLVKKEIVKRVLNNLENIQNINLADDLLWSIAFFLELKNKNTISAIESIGVNYLIHENSTTKKLSKKSFKKNINSINNVYKNINILFDIYKLNFIYKQLLIKNKFYALDYQFKKFSKKFIFFKILDFLQLFFYKKFYLKYYENLLLDFCIQNIKSLLKEKNIKFLSIFGTNDFAVKLNKSLKEENIRVEYFISSYQQKFCEIDNTPVILLNDILKANSDTIVISSIASVDEINTNLIKYKINENNIITVYS